MKNTLIVNLYAGPGAGKSTGAAYIFFFCKTQNGTVLTANTCLNTLKIVWIMKQQQYQLLSCLVAIT